MYASPDHIVAIAEDFGPHAGWGDSTCLEPLLSTAHHYGVLCDVWVYQLLDERDIDIFLVSVHLCPTVFAHPQAISWDQVQPDPGLPSVEAIRHVLARISEIAEAVRTAFLQEVATIVSGAVMPDGEHTT
jgi:hypothetical protein